jgi:hypothetical protein
MIMDRRGELDEQIEALARAAARLPYELLRRRCLAVVSDTLDFVREATGTVPPQCQPDIDRAFASALEVDLPRTLHGLQQALDTLDKLISTVSPSASMPAQLKERAKKTDTLLEKLRAVKTTAD